MGIADCKIFFRQRALRGMIKTLAILLVLSATACVTPSNRQTSNEEPDEPMTSVRVGAVGHYGDGMGVLAYAVNGSYGGNVSSWGGGRGMGAVSLPRHPSKSKDYSIRVDWVSCDVRNMEYDENNIRIGPYLGCIELKHSAVIPVHFTVDPGNSTGLYLHFLPGHKVEAWVTEGYPEGAGYPGPHSPEAQRPSLLGHPPLH